MKSWSFVKMTIYPNYSSGFVMKSQNANRFGNAEVFCRVIAIPILRHKNFEHFQRLKVV